MGDSIRVAWIDDKFTDSSDARTVQAQAIDQAGGDELSIELVQSTTTEFLGWVDQFNDRHRPRPDILILDFKLAHSPEFGKSLKLDDGYKLRKMLELTHLRLVPKYLVSAVFNARQVGPNVEGFEWILADPVDSELVARQLVSDGKGYRLINQFASEFNTDKDSAFQTLLGALGVPEGSADDVVELINHAQGRAEQSTSAKEYAQIDSSGIGPDARALTLSRWIRGILLHRLGPLIDAPSVANLVGADQDYFSQELEKVIQEQRPMAVYSGLFSHVNFPRWWRDEIVGWLVDSFDDVFPGPISQLAPSAAENLQIPKEHQSRCTVCGELWPDVVAQDVDDPEVVRQVHRYCSNALEDQDLIMGFDEVRIFQKD